MAATDPADIVVCDIVKAELYFGAERSQRRQANLKLYEEFFAQFRSLPFDTAAAREYGRIRAALEVAGTPVGPVDMLIAAIAIANDVVLVTHNTREFSRVPGLQLDDWET
jgi:tRNA(fMet)-specific endonuclease VapC